MGAKDSCGRVSGWEKELRDTYTKQHSTGYDCNLYNSHSNSVVLPPTSDEQLTFEDWDIQVDFKERRKITNHDSASD